MKTLRHLQTRQTSQRSVIPGREQDMMQNYAGGWSFKADKWTMFNRFLTTGTEGGTYHASEKTVTLDNIRSVDACLAEDGPRVVRELKEISLAGRAPKNDQAILTLARALKYQGRGIGDLNALATRRAAEAAVNSVCRIGTHIFQLAEAIDTFGGWGRLTTRAIAGWYESKSPDQIAFQATKYQQRGGWSHRDLIKLSHVLRNSNDKSLLSERARVYGWILDHDRFADYGERLPRIIEGFTRVQAETDAKSVAQLIRNYGLHRELIPTHFLNDVVVWEALLEKMPLTAMIRNLGKMSSIGLLDPMSDGARHVMTQLTNEQYLHSSRLHPINVLVSMKTYQLGHGIQGSLTWETNQRIIDALGDAFYGAFHNIEPINKRVLIAIDKSGSMGETYGVGRTATALDKFGRPTEASLKVLEAAAVMAMVTVRKSNDYFVLGYDAGYRELDISPKMTLDEVLRRLPHDGGATDASVPIRWAIDRKIKFDAMAFFSDGESWAGHEHASQSMNRYRQQSGLRTTFVTCDMVANQTQMVDNLDSLGFHVSGFDEAAPSLIQNFINHN